jgi:hypothetical protein
VGSTLDALYGDDVAEAPGLGFPFGAVGILTGPSGTLCSASLVQRDVVIAAAHCFCVGDSFPPLLTPGTSFQIPATGNQPQVGPIGAQHVWASGFESYCTGSSTTEEAGRDIACVQLSDPVPLGAANILSPNLGYHTPESAYTSWAVGYGGTSWGAGTNDPTRRMGPVFPVEVEYGAQGPYLISYNVDDGSTTLARVDSGGPLYNQHEGGMYGVFSALGAVNDEPDHNTWSPITHLNGIDLAANCFDDADGDQVSDDNDNCTPEEQSTASSTTWGARRGSCGRGPPSSRFGARATKRTTSGASSVRACRRSSART